MKISKELLTPFDFEGLSILDYTAGKHTSSSLAEITVLPGASHKKSWSNRSDKYYYVVSGIVQFSIDDELYELRSGDICVIQQGERFSYRNLSDKPAKVVLVHTPAFDLVSEVFDE